MADFESAVSKTLKNEGGWYHDPATGEYANFGITHWFLRGIGVFHPLPHNTPATDSEINYIRNLTPQDAAELYRKYFWAPVAGDSIVAQPIADKVFDAGVNMGVKPAVELLQQAANEQLPLKLAVDGEMGPSTLRAVNLLEPDKLLAAYKDLLVARYHLIAQRDPAVAHDLPGWIARAES